MTRISSGDELVRYLTLHKQLQHWLLHLHVLPLLLLHALWLLVFAVYSRESELLSSELLMLVSVCIALAQMLLWLASQWSVHVRAFITCRRASGLDEADVVKVVPTDNNGASELVRLQKSDLKGEEGEDCVHFWFEFQKLKYVYDENKKCFVALSFPIDLSVGAYVEARGHEDEARLARVQRKHGNNKLDMSLPSFNDLFLERATAPFFVFQVFCVGLWCLDEYWYYSLFTLLMLVVFECTLVKQQMRNMAEIRNMGNAPSQILVYRQRKWRYVSSDQLVVGDIVSVVNSEKKSSTENTAETKEENKNESGLIVPCDLVLVRGQCIVDESMLTGESVPQMKEGVEVINDRESYFEEESMSKLHMLYAGTKVVQCTPNSTYKSITSAVSKPGNNGCVGYVVRTGFHTSQGKLLRTILFGVRRITANNLETFLFITFLLMFAIAAAAYVWIKGTEDPSRNRYKLFLECTLILTSVVPPELPIELSLAVNTSLLSLTKLSIFCTEPFRIPFGGKVEICCFDKTGTLTSDHLVIDGVAGVEGRVDDDSKDKDESAASSKRNKGKGKKIAVTKIEETPLESIRVLATCHSLVQLDDGIIGDPLEKATLKAIEWNLTKGEVVIPRRHSKQSPMKIVHRHHFTSSLKRMTVIASYTDDYSSKQRHLVTVKGAPETLRAMYGQLPEDYDEIYLYHARRGARVLALGYRELSENDGQGQDLKGGSRLRDLSREELEQDLVFAGFVVISCPLKSDSKSIIQEILESCHRIVMITGDNALTAIHVAKQLGLVEQEKHTLMLKSYNNNTELKDESKLLNSQKWVWESVDSSIKVNFNGQNHRDDKKLLNENELCLTGDALSFLRENHPDHLSYLLPWVKVFARVSPKQKERVVTELNKLGFVTLMCGDGTNDVAALKHANVGVAILSSAPPSQSLKRRKKNDVPSTTLATNTSGNSATVDPRSKKKLVPRQEASRRSTPKASSANEQLQKMLKEMEEMEKASIVKLGDASIAAPFTAKHSSIEAVTHIIKQGRCTLVTTLQMFKILALNALILAYSQSVLYLEGVKFSDGQATLQGLLLATCFLFISRSKPLQHLSKSRPLPNIFNVYTIATVLLQFSVHFSCLVFLVQKARETEPRTEEFPDLEKEFEPNLLNSTVYMISMTLQLATFAINYRGHPYMESLTEHKPLLYCLLATGGFIVALATGMMPELSEQFAIVDFEPSFRSVLLQVLAADFVVSLVLDRLCLKLFGEGKLQKLR